MSHTSQAIHFVGSASGMAAQNPGCADGPQALKDSKIFSDALLKANISFQWDSILSPVSVATKLDTITAHCKSIADLVAKLAHAQKPFLVFGGDHSSAIGTWSGAFDAIREHGDMGLIWIDAHMDSHTPETSLTGNIHGMPLACLLGDGYPGLTNILNSEAKLKPQNLCLIGIRSFEEGEAEYLKQLNVRIFDMAEIKQRGIATVIKDAITHVTQNTVSYGVTIDIDSIDPQDAPGTGCYEPDGIRADDLCSAIKQFANDKRLIGREIVEFDPSRDKNMLTQHVITKLTLALLTGK
jgi:arginase